MHSIRDRVDLPLVYLAVEPHGASSSLVAELLGHPALPRLLGGGEAAAPALAILERFLSRSEGAMELALTGIRSRGEPELIFRGELTPADAETLDGVLRGSTESATRGVVRGYVEGHTVFGLPAGAAAGAAAGTPAASPAASPAGSLDVDVVLVGRELIVANARQPLRELLARGTTTARSLARHEVFARLRESLPTQSGDLMVFVDWPRFQSRLAGVDGVQDLLLSWSGMTRSGGLLATVRSVEGGLATTALLDRHGAGASGWMDLLEPAPLRHLARRFPAGGVASVLLAADPSRLASSGVGGAEFAVLRAALTNGCSGLGLSFDNQVLRQLAGTGGVRLMMVAGADGIEPVWSLTAKSRGAASELFDDLRRAVVQADLGEWIKERGRVDRLQLGGAADPERRGHRARHPHVFGGQPLWIAVAGDSLVAARTDAALESAVAASRERNVDLTSVWGAAGFDRNAKDVVGLVYSDLAPLLDPAEAEGFPTRHVGAIRMAKDHLRMEVVSPR